MRKENWAYRKHHHHLAFAFYDYAQVEAHLEAAEGFVDEGVPDLRGGDEARGCGEEVGGGESGGLDAEGAEDEEGFFCENYQIRVTKKRVG